MYKKLIGFLVLIMATSLGLLAQASSEQLVLPNTPLQDSVAFSIDTLQIKTVDLLTPRMLKVRDSATNAVWLDSLSKGYGFAVFSLKDLVHTNFYKERVVYQEGSRLSKGNVWILAVIGSLLLIFAVLKNAFGKQLSAVVQSFYSNRALSNLNKEDNLVTSWSFLLLFVQFGFVIGLFFYLVAQYKMLPAAQDGFVFYLGISVGVILLYLLKILVLRFIGFVFDIRKPVHQYISILYLSYFNASLLFFPLVIAFALSPANYGAAFINMGVFVLIITFVFQSIRAGVNVISNYNFSKLYLLLYLCTLEICPILILIKGIGI